MIAYGRSRPSGHQGVENLRETYVNWTTVQLKKMKTRLDQLEDLQDGSPDHLILELFGFSHDIKGLGGSFGYFLMTDIATSLCEYLRYREETSDITITIIRDHITAMDHVISEGIVGEGGGKEKQDLQRLQKLTKNTQAAAHK